MKENQDYVLGMLSRFALFGIIGASVGIIGSVWSLMKRKSGIEDDTQVFMFKEAGKFCRDHANSRMPCKKHDCPVGHLNKIQKLLGEATKTIDVCMYVMTCDDLTEGIIRSRRKGAQVRLIVDSDMHELPACNHQLWRFLREGIEVRMNSREPSSLMHHKFAIIDGKFLLFGSTNWTMQAFFGNNDSIILTNDRQCRIAYAKEFEDMWIDFGATMDKNGLSSRRKIKY